MYIAGEPVAFRGLEPSDFGFIVPTWCNSVRDVVKGIKRDALADSSKASCVLALEHADWVVACSKEMPTTIYGWACFAPLCGEHIKNQNTAPIYAFTTYPMRRNGLFSAMKEHYVIACKASGDTRPSSTRRRPVQQPHDDEGGKAVAEPLLVRG